MRVLAFPAFASRKNNPYTSSLYDALTQMGVTVYEYGTAAALSRRYAILHVHWPEVPLNRGQRASRLSARWFLALIDVARRRGAKLVWTVHNLRSHEQRFPEQEAEFFREFVARVDAFIALTHSGEEAVRRRFPALEGRPSFVVPHHHYRGTYADDVGRDEARRALGLAEDARVVLFFGQIMAYKNVPALVRTVRGLSSEPRATLLVAGRPKTAADEAELRAAAAGDPRIRLDLGFVAHERAQFYFRAADLVVLPYREILNSGAAVLALSFDRPVLLPDLGACRELGEQIGGGWVTTYSELTGETLERALDGAARLPERTDGSQLATLDVEVAARRTLDAYRTLVE
jgi:glycosyltransferase involved in cell wall biosynthesis